MERYFAERPRGHHQETAFSPAQELQFELMKLASFNGFDGERVVRDLTQRPDLWVAALMDRFDATDRLVPLRDLAQGHWNADTLLLLTDSMRRRDVEGLARTWRPTELDWLKPGASASLLGVPASAGLKILRAWWD